MLMLNLRELSLWSFKLHTVGSVEGVCVLERCHTVPSGNKARIRIVYFKNNDN